MLLPPNLADPKSKEMIDALVEAMERERSRRAWSFWLSVGAASVAALWSVQYETLPDFLRLSLAVVGGLGLLAFLFFLSTKPFGRGYYAGPQWWF
jgi:hypothetical protein